MQPCPVGKPCFLDMLVLLWGHQTLLSGHLGQERWGGRARGTWPAAPTPSFPHPQLLQLTAPTTPVPQGMVPGGCEAAQVSSGHPLEFSVKTWRGWAPLLRRLESACLQPGRQD